MPNKNKLSKISPRLINFCQSGNFSPNLVTRVGGWSRQWEIKLQRGKKYNFARKEEEEEDQRQKIWNLLLLLLLWM